MIIDRLKQYIDSKGITISAFERSIGMSNASLNKSFKQGKSIRSDNLEQISISGYKSVLASYRKRGNAYREQRSISDIGKIGFDRR